MNWLDLPRRPEPEVMGEAGEVEAYASAAALQYLDAVDDTLVEQAIRLSPEGTPPAGRLLDVGCGPGGIALKMARRCANLMVVGLDRSRPMIEAARRAAREQRLASRVSFVIGDGNGLSFPDASFDFVLSNSVLHHLENPVLVFNEMARVRKPGGVILVRDLRRPSRLLLPFHIQWHGRYYSGLMRELYVRSVRAAYTAAELADLLARSALAEAQIFSHRGTHLGFVDRGRSAPAPLDRPS